MTQEDVLAVVLDALEHCGVGFMVTGSFAGNLHGLPRATQDADVVVEGGRLQLENFVAELGSAFYPSREAAREVFEHEAMFNVIHLESGFKVDLIVRKSRPFSREEFSRRGTAELAGRPPSFASPEDVILSKLEWSKLGNSERQYLDALNVARVATRARRSTSSSSVVCRRAPQCRARDLSQARTCAGGRGSCATIRRQRPPDSAVPTSRKCFEAAAIVSPSTAKSARSA